MRPTNNDVKKTLDKKTAPAAFGPLAFRIVAAEPAQGFEGDEAAYTVGLELIVPEKLLPYLLQAADAYVLKAQVLVKPEVEQ